MPGSRTSIRPPLKRCRAWRTSSPTRTPRTKGPGIRIGSPEELNSARRSSRHRGRGDRRSGGGCGSRRSRWSTKSCRSHPRSKQAMAPGCAGPAWRRGKGTCFYCRHNDPHHDPQATWADQAWRHRKRIRRSRRDQGVHLSLCGSASVPMQPSGSVAKWDGDKLTFWGMGQGIYPVRARLPARSASIRRRSGSSINTTGPRSAADPAAARFIR